MLKSKKISLLIIISLLMIISVGCASVEVNFLLNSDNTGYLTATTSIEDSILKTLEEEGKLSNRGKFRSASLITEDETYRMVNEDYFEITEQYREEEINGQNFQIDTLDIGFDNTKSFLSKRLTNVTPKLKDIGQGKTRFYLSSAEIKSRYNLKNEDLEGANFTFNVTTDFMVTGHNADKVEGNTYTWNMINQLKNNEEAFLEYETDKKAEVVVPVKPSNPDGKRAEGVKWISILKTNPEYHGNALNRLGILRGTDKGLELDKPLTRIEGAIMYSRLLDLEDEINLFQLTNPTYTTGFVDVPEWAAPTVNYLQFKGLISGVGNNMYGSSTNMTEAQYATLVLRALGFDDKKGDFNWQTAGMKLLEIGLFDEEDIMSYEKALENGFNRRAMSYYSFNAMFYKNKITGKYLIDNFKL